MALKKLNRQSVVTKERPIRVLQFGEGNFLRAFADWMIDILNEKTEFNGDIQVIQPRAHSAQKGKLVNEQDGLYHVVIKGIRQGKPVKETRLITCLREVINAYEDQTTFFQTATNPTLRFVISNTTEAGICFKDEGYDNNHVAETFPGKLTQWLYQRYNFFQGDPSKGLILLPCELLERNGDALKDTILQYIAHWNLPDSFRQWLLNENTFCNSLVDRIVPGFPQDSIAEIETETGYDDKLVVMAEPFYVWVIEANQKLKDELPAQAAGLNVKLVNDLVSYRTQKVRILNGAHTVMVPVAYLRGMRTVGEVMQDQAMCSFVESVIQDEIIPSLHLPDEDLQQFASDVKDRFANPFIRHELASIALNSISKFKVRVVPSILEYHQRQHQLPKKLVHAFGALICFYRGSWNGESLPLNDDPAAIKFFAEQWKTNDPTSIANATLKRADLWGQDLSEIPGLTSQLAQEIEFLLKRSQ
ncbi:tagaturonate reductase [Pseudochryseolinea flava]|uniref:Tagaturonate reductase n=1 Tax=Pseudochryseolinea flava TaxID=2059302 RepID=A0A364Y0B4_9BACT|nr:tagaturonate reductase [Pseudochryseolinea flava]RAW00038.1 tagaturonate reductase [Pseudochryseolinea flava]